MTRCIAPGFTDTLDGRSVPAGLFKDPATADLLTPGKDHEVK
jgi:hypothetical protein